MTIGQAAKASGVSAKMIRYYEDSGLLPAAIRSQAGYRHYMDADIHRLQFIRRARDLGFSMQETGNLLSLWADRSRQSADVKRIAQEHIRALELKIMDLQQMAQTLQSLVHACHGDGRPDCPILASLADNKTAHTEPEQRACPHCP
ncbi:Cu(I)-responsive transcriptional regulator [Lampropedia puyangensis]|uniref:Cu(I)-responsive transcriptional regulator n=1 Tax=Lampropedia puyangensis TaxID=1330072 RepID=A0A4S8F4M9_9BURK|nr:Cu(I)-responsive transcriptional regulator [Lampropedia puyangensis]THU01094.1 Cu(I)-responsive transcriptional regulator [Lampropedia puyangensis]